MNTLRTRIERVAGCCKRRNALNQTGVVSEGSMRASVWLTLLPPILSTTYPWLAAISLTRARMMMMSQPLLLFVPFCVPRWHSSCDNTMVRV